MGAGRHDCRLIRSFEDTDWKTARSQRWTMLSKAAAQALAEVLTKVPNGLLRMPRRSNAAASGICLVQEISRRAPHGSCTGKVATPLWSVTPSGGCLQLAHAGCDAEAFQIGGGIERFLRFKWPFRQMDQGISATPKFILGLSRLLKPAL